MALAYEGVVAQVVATAQPLLAMAVSDAALTDWRVCRGQAGADEERQTSGAWETIVHARARLET